MPTVNELLADEAIRHQVAIAKYTNHTVRSMVGVLNRSEQRLFAELYALLETVNPSTFQMQRLQTLLTSVWTLNTAAYAAMGAGLRKDLNEFARYEVDYQQNMLTQYTPVQLNIATVSAEQVYAAAMARPFQGRLLQDVLTEIPETRAKRIRTAIAQGYTEAKTTDQIIREIRGTKKNNYADGLLEGSRRELATIVRTAVSHTAGMAQDIVAEENADILEAVVWSATLDLRTSEICRIRDGKKYTAVGHKPIGHSLPWLGGPGRAHYSCRSAQVYAVKSLEELLGLSGDVTLRNGTRASMDGQVPKEVNYAEWIKKQTFERQSEVLGPTRAKLLRKGNLPLERMYGLKGQFLNLDQLRAQDAAAFKRAGL